MVTVVDGSEECDDAVLGVLRSTAIPTGVTRRSKAR
jgi:urocanate hydratase